MHRDVIATVVCDDGERERLQLESEYRCFVESSSAPVSNTSSGNVDFSDNVVVDVKPAELKMMSEYFGNKPISRHQAR